MMIKKLMVTAVVTALTLGVAQAQTAAAGSRLPSYKHMQRDDFVDVVRANFTLPSFDQQAEKVDAINFACSQLIALGRSAMQAAGHDKPKLAALVTLINSISSISLGNGVNLDRTFAKLSQDMQVARRAAARSTCSWNGTAWVFVSGLPNGYHSQEDHKRPWCPNDKCVTLQVLAHTQGADASRRLFGAESTGPEIRRRLSEIQQQVALGAAGMAKPVSLADQLVVAIAAARANGGALTGASQTTAKVAAAAAAQSTTPPAPKLGPTVKKAGTAIENAVKKGVSAAKSQP